MDENSYMVDYFDELIKTNDRIFKEEIKKMARRQRLQFRLLFDRLYPIFQTNGQNSRRRTLYEDSCYWW